jgi:hypothetical protein
VLKRNELSSHEKTKKNLTCILVSKRDQPEKATHWMTLNPVTGWKRQLCCPGVRWVGRDE